MPTTTGALPTTILISTSVRYRTTTRPSGSTRWFLLCSQLAGRALRVGSAVVPGYAVDPQLVASSPQSSPGSASPAMSEVADPWTAGHFGQPRAVYGLPLEGQKGWLVDRPRAGLPPFRKRWFRDLMDIIRFEGPMAAIEMEQQLDSQESDDG